VSQLFPGKDVVIAAACVATGDPIRVVMRDSNVVQLDPESAVAHANVPMDRWGQPSWAFT